MLNIPFLPILDATGDADKLRATLEASGTRGLIDHANWSADYPYKPLAAFNIAHSGTHIYIDFFVRGLGLRAENSADQSPVSQDSCVEFFVSPSCDNRYFNFEFNCIGAINASVRSERKNPCRLTADELAMVRRYPSCGTDTFSERDGLHSWSLLVVIPLELIGVDFTGKPVVMTANFYKCASASCHSHYLSWAPISAPAPDFHITDAFAPITLMP